jgi:hypothetical protein
MAGQERDSAVQRLESALVEQDRLDERFDAAVGTTTEFGAYVRFQAAGERVSARDRRVGQIIKAERAMEEPMATKVSVEHDRAAQRLKAALAEHHRLRDGQEGATGKFAELAAEVALHAADQEVAARDAWLKWVDDEHYHGLNAGPFELFAENLAP